MTTRRLLDLFCGAGGASAGYAAAGFTVFGVDNRKQPRYPYAFIRADAMEVLTDLDLLNAFDVIHASPPCQAFTSLRHRWGTEHPDLLAPTRRALRQWGGTYVIENVPGAPMRGPLVVCGAALGLAADGYTLRRHRLFESNVFLMGPPCACSRNILGVYGKGGGYIDPTIRGNKANLDQSRRIMQAPWMNRAELSQAIPPAYTRLVGEQVLAQLDGRKAV